MSDASRPDPLLDPLAFVGEHMRDALDGIDLPAFVADRAGTVRWANGASTLLIGARVGHSLVAVIPRVDGAPTAYDVTLVDAEGAQIVVRVRTSPLRGPDKDVVGLFGVAVPIRANRGSVVLTPRQEEVLQLLAEGLSTDAVAKRLGVALETARNHIRAVLRRLEVHSRLEAVVEARRRGILDD
jgi:DNA-binding CsgD family transcriptional regulator